MLLCSQSQSVIAKKLRLLSLLKQKSRWIYLYKTLKFNISRHDIPQQNTHAPTVLAKYDQRYKKTSLKSIKRIKQGIPKRRSLRLQNIEAFSSSSSAHVVEDASTNLIAAETPRPSTKEYKIQTFESDDENLPLSKYLPMCRISSTSCSNDAEMSAKKAKANSYTEILQQMKRNGCVAQKLVEKRIYAIAMHHRDDFLLVAAASTGGTIGMWQIESAKNQEDLGSTCAFPTYTRTVSNLIFSQAKPNKLYFSSYAGAVRSLDLAKSVFDEAVYDDDSTSISTFGIFDPANDGILAGSYGGELFVLDPRSKNLTTTVHVHERVIKSVSVHPQSNHYFATSSNDRMVKIHDLRFFSSKKKGCLAEITNHSQTVDSAYFSPATGSQLLSTSLDNTIRVYDVSNISSPSMTSCISHNNHTGRWLSNFRAVWHPAREDVIAIGSMMGPFRQIDVFDSTLSRICTLTDEEHLTSICSLLAMHPSRHVIAGGNSSGKTFIFEG